MVITHYLIFSSLLFSIGFLGFFVNRKNLIILLMCIELILLAVSTNFIAFSNFWNDLHGQIFVLFIIALAGAEACVGLAILVVMFRRYKSIDIDKLNTLKG